MATRLGQFWIYVCALAVGCVAADTTRAGGQIAQPYDWTGLYFGASVNISALEAQLRTNGLSRGSDRSSGAGVSILSGYLRQVSDRHVIGYESDMTWDERSAVFGGDTFDLTHWGTFRARAGVLLKPNLLAFASLGAAYADVDFMDMMPTGRAKGSAHIWGVVGSAGLEFASGRHVRLRSEYLYANFPDWDINIGQIRHSLDQDVHVVRLTGVVTLDSLRGRRGSK